MRTEAVMGDITTQEVDAIVNAASPSLLGGGGVDGAIHRAAGPGLLQECRELRRTRLPDGLAVGAAVVTSGYDLPARWVVHTVGPNRYAGEDDPALLRLAFRTCLGTVLERGWRSVALPAVSAGVFGWSKEEVAQAAVAEARAVQEAVRWAEVRHAAAQAGADWGDGDQAGPDRGDGDQAGPDQADQGQPTAPGTAGQVLELVRFVLASQEILDAFRRELDRAAS